MSLLTLPRPSLRLPRACAVASAVFTVCGLVGATAPCSAQSASESFDYPSGTVLQGQGGGTGFTGPWQAGGFNVSVSTNYTVGSGSLAFSDLLTSGNHVTTEVQNVISGVTRALTTPLGTPGTTRYLSFLIRPEGTVGAGLFDGFFGLYLNASTGNDLFIGKPGSSNLYALEDRGGGQQQLTTTTAVSGETHFFVVRADFTGGVDQFTLFIDPTLGQAEPLTGTVKNNSDVGTVSGLTLYSGGAYSLDEIRIGDTFASVTPTAAATAVPEPGEWAVMGMLGTSVGGLMVHARRRKAKSDIGRKAAVAA